MKVVQNRKLVSAPEVHILFEDGQEMRFPRNFLGSWVLSKARAGATTHYEGSNDFYLEANGKIIAVGTIE